MLVEYAKELNNYLLQRMPCFSYLHLFLNLVTVALRVLIYLAESGGGKNK